MRKRLLILVVIGCLTVPGMICNSEASETVADPLTPDTVIVGNVATFATGTVVTPINFVNDEALGGIEITLIWNSLEVVLDSVSFVGSRVEYAGLKGAIIDSNTVIIHSIPFGQPDIPPGFGLFCKLYYSYPINIPSQTVIIDSLTIIDGQIVHAIFFSDAFAQPFVPQFQSGSIVFTDPTCCIGIRGNVDNGADDRIDIADLTELVKYIFQGGPEPPCRYEANINGDPEEQIDISDLTYLIRYVFQGGPQPADCP